MMDFFAKLFDTSDFPPRWHCGNWSTGHGYLHIASDLATFGAYMALPVAIIWFLFKRRDVPFPRVHVFFALFIVTCGLTHLNEAIIFYEPIYRWAGLNKLLTALASWATVLALIPVIPTALSMRTAQQLEDEIDRQTSALRETQQQLAKTNATLERRVRARTSLLERTNEELESFAYAASHDLREPLRMISSYTELLGAEYADTLDDEGREYLRFAHDGAKRMHAMLEGLLEYSRLGSREIELKPVNLDRVVADARENLQVSIDESSAEIRVEALGEALGSESLLTALLQNLLSNAIRFCGEAAPRIEVEAERSGDHVHLRVRDHGVGFDMRHRERIFQVFERLHRDESLGGTGVGLAIARRIAERHRGRLWAESVSGEGATFHLELRCRRESDEF